MPPKRRLTRFGGGGQMYTALAVKHNISRIHGTQQRDMNQMDSILPERATIIWWQLGFVICTRQLIPHKHRSSRRLKSIMYAIKNFPCS